MKLLLLSLSTLILTGCNFNKAEQRKAKKESFTINEEKVLTLLSRKHSTIPSSLTVFYLPDSAENSDVDIQNAGVSILEEKRQIAKTLVENSARINKHVTSAKEAAKFLYREDTQCINLLTAVQGQKICKEKEEEMQAGLRSLTNMISIMRNNILSAEDEIQSLDVESEMLKEKLGELDNEQLEEAESINLRLIEIEESIQKQNKTIETLKSNLIDSLLPKKLDVEGKIKQCESLPALYESLTPVHKNIPECIEKKTIAETNKAKAEELGKQIVMAVGPQNWYKTDPNQSELFFDGADSKVTLTFGQGDLITYSTEDRSIVDVSWEPNNRSFKFTILEKTIKENEVVFTGNTLKVSLEKGAYGDVQTYGGSIKKYENGFMIQEGKLSLEFSIIP